jgi:hypothetical protein
MLAGNPKQVIFTPNSDTPYSFVPIDLSIGPVVIELPPGPVMGAVNDLNQRWVLDFGLPGPDAGKGGRHLLLPPGYQDEVPPDYYAATATTNRVSVLLRALPIKGDNEPPIDLIKSVLIRPLDRDAPWKPIEWIDISDKVTRRQVIAAAALRAASCSGRSATGGSPGPRSRSRSRCSDTAR